MSLSRRLTTKWNWQLFDKAGRVLAVTGIAAELWPEEFSSQSDAETWLGERWRDLADSGVASVTLLADDNTEYGPMDLRPE